jgi:hypothetical protein
VFWYCHKRGREVRLEKERELTEQEVAQLEKEYTAMHPNEIPTTTAAQGAAIPDVEAGIKEVQEARQKMATVDLERNKDPAELIHEPGSLPV